MTSTRPVRLLCVLGALFSLTACNVVTSEKPLFAASGSGLSYRNGVWAVERDSWRPEDDGKPCAWDEAAPAKTWPACAGEVVVRDGTWPAPPGPPGAQEIIVPGDPMISQMFVGDQLAGNPAMDASPSKDAKGPPAMASRPYLYAGLTARSDAEGRVVAFRKWPIVCGPPPVTPGPLQNLLGPGGDGKAAPDIAREAASKLPPLLRLGTDRPFPGLVMDELRADCTATSQRAVRDAAGQTLALSPPFIGWRWVRDGED